MKHIALFTAFIFLFCFTSYAQFGDILKKVENKAEEKTDNAEDSLVNKVMNPQASGANKTNQQTNKASENNNQDADATSTGSQQQVNTKTYQNYDFVPGDKIIFEDNFAGDESGEFPSHWDLLAGQAQVSTFQGENIFALTEGNYVSVVPLMKTDTYLSIDTFTVEFDYYTQPGAYNSVGIRFWNPKNEDQNNNSGDEYNSVFAGYECTANDLSGTYPEDEDSFSNNKWHHVAIARKGRQLKVYEDQYRVLNVPVFKGNTYSVDFVGIGDQDKPIMLKNIRIALGGNFNDTKHIMTESRIITHGILFDVDKATIKPQSMGTINEIYKLLEKDPSLKFEIDGHTDNTGDAKHNLELSQQRADAVKAQLVNMGIDASRLSTKGFGDTKPIADNSTPEGKANNRRVEFVKI
jgi:OOP family OmpA-OmpF porin